MENCPVIEAIKKNVKSDMLPEFFQNGLNSALRSADDCQGPGTIAVERQEGFLLWSRTITEPRTVCGLFSASQDAVVETPQPAVQQLSGAQQPLLEY